MSESEFEGRIEDAIEDAYGLDKLDMASILIQYADELMKQAKKEMDKYD